MRKSYYYILFFLASTLVSAQTPIAHYNFDNTLNDETGTWNLAASSGFTPTFEAGYDGTVNGAVSGFGVEDFLTTSGNFTPLEGSADRTIVAWVKLPVGQGGNQAVVGLGDNNSDFQKFTFGGISANSGTNSRNRVEVRGNGASGTTILTNDTWVHIAVTYTAVGSSKFELYVNGALDSDKTIPDVINTAANPLLVGNDYSFNGTSGLRERGWKGAIDDLRIFDSVLTAAQIDNIYDNTLDTDNFTVKNEALKIFPNPVKDRLQLVGLDNSDVQSLEVYNILGVKVLSENVLGDNSLDVTTLTEGIYLLKFLNRKDDVISTVRVVKQN